MGKNPIDPPRIIHTTKNKTNCEHILYAMLKMDGPMKHETSARCRASRSVEQSMSHRDKRRDKEGVESPSNPRYPGYPVTP